ncbi:MAG: four helix bundle protein [Candidatus Moranbacteria bacterium]|nr:four helix bundle protein [Candidatus Moranbacteria bacterium]
MAKIPPPLSLSLSIRASILQRIKEGYLIWLSIVPHMQKGARYTIGARIENKFLDLLELAYVAYFSKKEEKVEKIAECIFLLDKLKFLVSVAWEGKLISNRHFEEIAAKLDEMGRMSWGWKEKMKNPGKKNRDL